MILDVRRDETEAATLIDRRRPGRRDTVNPNLLPLLRAEERARWPALVNDGTEATPEHLETSGMGELRDRHLDAGEGMALAVGLGVIMWTLIIIAGRVLIDVF